jgi:hypothetical protein
MPRTGTFPCFEHPVLTQDDSQRHHWPPRAALSAEVEGWLALLTPEQKDPHGHDTMQT